MGVSGAGKTTLAARLGRLLDVPHVEIDALFHGPGWTPREAFVADVDEVSETAPYGGCECPSLLRFARIYSFLLRTAVFSDPRLAPYRREYFIIIVRATVLIMALMWVCLPV